MLEAIFQYSRERCPISVLLIISAILMVSVVQSVPPVGIALLTVSVACLILFLFRLSDDLCDISIDKVAHPDRYLCRHDQGVQWLKQFRGLAIAIVLLGSTWVTPKPVFVFKFLLLSLAFWSLFFCLKPNLPTLLHTLFLNGSLGVLPIYTGLVIHGTITRLHVLMAIFFWLGGFAHDLSHSLVDLKTTPENQIKPLHKFDQRQLAIISSVTFLACSIVGCLLFYFGEVGLLFLITLLANTLYMLYLENELIRHPSQETANPFYVFGFVFFLLPVLANTIENIVKSLIF